MQAKVTSITGPWDKERKVVKGFRDSTLMYKWLNEQDNNRWSVYDGPLKPGTYAFVGGQWQNVKSLPASVLAHV